MNGMERMLKAMGIDPQQLANQFGAQMQDTVNQVKNEFDILHARMEAMEQRLITIENHLMEKTAPFEPHGMREAMDAVFVDDEPRQDRLALPALATADAETMGLGR